MMRFVVGACALIACSKGHAGDPIVGKWESEAMALEFHDDGTVTNKASEQCSELSCAKGHWDAKGDTAYEVQLPTASVIWIHPTPDGPAQHGGCTCKESPPVRFERNKAGVAIWSNGQTFHRPK